MTAAPTGPSAKATLPRCLCKGKALHRNNKSTGTEQAQQREVLKENGSDAFIDINVSHPNAKNNSIFQIYPKKYFVIDLQCTDHAPQKETEDTPTFKATP